MVEWKFMEEGMNEKKNAEKKKWREGLHFKGVNIKENLVELD